MTHYPELIMKLFGSQEVIQKIPVIQFKQEFNGDTGYIDRITTEDFKQLGQCPGILKGVDDRRRKFFTFCYEQKVNDQLPRYDVFTIFERTPGGRWVSAGHYKLATEQLFRRDRFKWYRIMAMSEEEYFKYYPLETIVKEGTINLLSELMYNGMVLTKNTLIPPSKVPQDVYDDFPLEEEKCEIKHPRIGKEFQATV